MCHTIRCSLCGISRIQETSSFLFQLLIPGLKKIKKYGVLICAMNFKRELGEGGDSEIANRCSVKMVGPTVNELCVLEFIGLNCWEIEMCPALCYDGICPLIS